MADPPGFRSIRRSSVILGMLASRDPSESEKKMRSPKRNRRLQFEVMESREVLSASLAGASLAPPTLVTFPDKMALAVSLTTDHSVYQRGQPVNITLTETNISSHDVQVTLGPSIDGFSITHNGALVWISNKGPVPQFLTVETLKPGQSITLQATWDGRSNVGPPTTPTGVFVVHNALIPNGPTATFIIVPQKP
jgi:Intracellular proteinase inhibitor